MQLLKCNILLSNAPSAILDNSSNVRVLYRPGSPSSCVQLLGRSTLQERWKKFRFESLSDFIRAAVIDDEIKVVTEVHQDSIRKDYTELIKSTVECIRTLDFRMRRAQDDFQKAIKCPGVDPEFIEVHAYRLRLITLLGEGHEKDG